MNYAEEAYWDGEISKSVLDELADKGKLFLDNPVAAVIKYAKLPRKKYIPSGEEKLACSVKGCSIWLGYSLLGGISRTWYVAESAKGKIQVFKEQAEAINWALDEEE
jgi:hypothetical protein